MILPTVENPDVLKITWKGLLCDWEMSKRTDLGLDAPRQPERTVRQTLFCSRMPGRQQSVLGNVAVHVCGSVEL